MFLLLLLDTHSLIQIMVEMREREKEKEHDDFRFGTCSLRPRVLFVIINLKIIFNLLLYVYECIIDFNYLNRMVVLCAVRYCIIINVQVLLINLGDLILRISFLFLSFFIITINKANEYQMQYICKCRNYIENN